MSEPYFPLSVGFDDRFIVAQFFQSFQPVSVLSVENLFYRAFSGNVFYLPSAGMRASSFDMSGSIDSQMDCLASTDGLSNCIL